VGFRFHLLFLLAAIADVRFWSPAFMRTFLRTCQPKRLLQRLRAKIAVSDSPQDSVTVALASIRYKLGDMYTTVYVQYATFGHFPSVIMCIMMRVQPESSRPRPARPARPCGFKVVHTGTGSRAFQSPCAFCQWRAPQFAAPVGKPEPRGREAAWSENGL
jgi:hypothetical protein